MICAVYKIRIHSFIHFCLMKLNGLKEEHYFNEISPKGTEMRIEVIFCCHESFVGFCFLDLENETCS